MTNRYRLMRRDNGTYYFIDQETGKRTSTKTKMREEAEDLLFAKNQSVKMPAFNREMAKIYLAGSSPELLQRTWQAVIDDILAGYAHNASPSTVDRWQRINESEPFMSIKPISLIDTRAEHFLQVLRHPRAGVSTNTFLRRIHNHALNLGWLLAPVLVRKAWPAVQFGERRGITKEEHEKILAAENRKDRRYYYELLWETGGSQSDIAALTADRVDWREGTLLYRRMKTQKKGYEFAKIKMGVRLSEILSDLPREGYLFPALAEIPAQWRSSEFRRRCKIAGVTGVSLHCYRYAWAERAASANVPIRVSMETLGHQSRAVHQAYAKKAEITLLPLEHYEKCQADNVIQLEEHLKAKSEERPHPHSSPQHRTGQ